VLCQPEDRLTYVLCQPEDRLTYVTRN